MDDAAKVLIVGAILNLDFVLLIGIPIALIRQKQPAYSKYLRLAHIGPMFWAPILFGLVFAVTLSDLDPGIESLAAWLMVIASVLLTAKDVINWRMEVKDEFAEKPTLMLAMGTLSSLASIISAGIFTIGIFSGL